MLTIGPYQIKNPYILAPMAGVSQMPFRRLALKFGAGLAPTELISAKGLFFANARTKSYLVHDATYEKPFCVQLFGGEKESMAEAARKAVGMGAQILDINMGCPVKKVTKTNAGSALLCDLKRAESIIKAMLKATEYKIPITAKIRSGWDDKSLNYLAVGKALEESGISALALHARTRAQGYAGFANWSHIAELKSRLKIPIIGNGDIKSLEEADLMKEKSGCDAVMIGRAALGNPWIFSQAPENRERLLVIHEHLDGHIDLCRLIADDSKILFSEAQAIKSFRSHLIWYSKGLSGGASFRSLVMAKSDPKEVRDLIDVFFDKAQNESLEEIDDGIDYRQAFG